MECERCGSEDNVTTFVYYDGRDDEVLCWDCREPIVLERARQGGVHRGGETDTELDGQTGLTDF